MATARLPGKRVRSSDRNVSGPAPDSGGSGSKSGGTVRSVALALPSIFTVSGSPVKQAGTLTGTLATQSANRVFAGPTTGAAAAPTFRALVAADHPAVLAALANLANAVGVLTNDGAGALSWGAGGGREKLTADRTYYVRTDGNDANTGLANTSGGAFLTLQKAVDVACSIDASIYNVTIQVADGTYTVTTQVTLKAYLGAGTFTIQGNTTTPANVVITRTTTGFVFFSDVKALWRIRGVKITNSGTGASDGIRLQGGFVSTDLIDFGAITRSAMSLLVGATWILDGAMTISGNCTQFLFANGCAKVLFSGALTVTLTGTPAFSTAFAIVQQCAEAFLTATYSGSATGTRWSASSNGVIAGTGGAATYLPGNVNGAATTGGQYV